MLIGYGIFVHKFFSFEDKEAGYPKCYLYTDIETMRFDWIKVFDADQNLSPCQLCCLIELESPNMGSIFLFIGTECEFCEFDYKHVDDKPVFPLIRYKKTRKTKTNKSGDLRLIVDLVDRVIEPSMVVPTSCLSSDYFLSDKESIDRVRFFCPPVEFLLRDNWKDMVHLPEIKRTLHSDLTVHKYITGSANCRNLMYKELINSLSKNGDHQNDDDEEEEEDDDDEEEKEEEEEDEEEEIDEREGKKRRVF
jgi:hypothetical protein